MGLMSDLGTTSMCLDCSQTKGLLCDGMHWVEYPATQSLKYTLMVFTSELSSVIILPNIPAQETRQLHSLHCNSRSQGSEGPTKVDAHLGPDGFSNYKMDGIYFPTKLNIKFKNTHSIAYLVASMLGLIQPVEINQQWLSCEMTQQPRQ